MDELEYCYAMAREIVASNDERLRAILAWVDDIHLAIKACDGDNTKRPTHSALVAGMLMMELSYVEKTGNIPMAMVGNTLLNNKDYDLVTYTFKPILEKRLTEITAQVVNPFGLINDKYSFKLHEFKLIDNELNVPSEAVSKIILNP